VSLAATLPATASAVIEARGLRHRYRPQRGLEAVTFSLSSPGAVAVVGANGSGKSTLLRIVAGLLRPSEGELKVEVDGRPIPPPGRRPVVGFAAPDLEFYDELSCLENLAFAAEARGLPAPREAARAALARTELAGRADDRVAALSSGMTQRLRLAFALLHRPAILLLDEPGSHLDEAGRELLARLVVEESARGLVLIATNDEKEGRLAGERIELRGRGLGHPA
jgi:heme exporter protein A